MNRYLSTFILTIAVSCLPCAEVMAQRGRGTGLPGRGGSMGGSSIRGGGGSRSLGGHRPSTSIGGNMSGRSKYSTNIQRRVPNSAASIRSLQPSNHSNYGSHSQHGSHSHSGSSYPSYSRSRLGGSSLGIYIGGSSLNNRYGSFGYSPYGSYGNFGYSAYQPYGYYNNGYSVRQPTYSSVNVVVPLASTGPVLPAPTAVQQPVVDPQQGGSLPRNMLPQRSIVTNGAPNIGQPGKAVLFNPSESGGNVNYVLNGRQYTIRPGEAQPIDLDRTWTLEFDRGLNNESGHYTLTEGIHKFGVGQRGWEVVPVQPTTGISNKLPSTSPAPPVPIQALPQTNSNGANSGATLYQKDPLTPIPDIELPTIEAPGVDSF